MLTVILRTVIVYFAVLLIVRIMGKSELSKMSPFQMVVMFMIAELASMPIESDSLALMWGLAAIFTLLILQVLISFISLKWEWFKTFINGKPSIIIENGSINHKEMLELRISINDLCEQLRLGGTPSLTDVDFAIMEANGDLSIITKDPNKNNILPTVIISDGVLYRDNLKKSHIEQSKLKTEMSDKDIRSIKDVFLCFADEDSKLHFFAASNSKDTIKEV